MTQNSAKHTAKDFRAWRKRTTFATDEIARRAELVQFDLDALAYMELKGYEVESYQELARKNIAELVALLDALTIG